MWLLDTALQQLEYFQGNQIPPSYAILSHRWQGEEVTFEDIQDQADSYTLKHGWSKVLMTCQLARTNGIDYVWIDSCCIDKRSSAELSEAINSMYEWYARATVCYTYLFDVYDASDIEQFCDSSWFTRSWTLQELLAPTEVYFYTAEWTRIGSKSDMSKSIHVTTGIPVSALEFYDSSQYSIAIRMSWAAKRQATRIEDVAYSLLGIFDINMPLLYGEGSKAFQRLQEAIMSESNDLSLFLWHGWSCPKFGMLAASPSAFPGGTRIQNTPLKLSRGYTFNNAGLSIELKVQPLFRQADGLGVYAAYLHDPHDMSLPTLTKPRIYLRRDERLGQYYRVSIGGRGWDIQEEDESVLSPSRLCRLLIQKDHIAECGSPLLTQFVIWNCPPGVQTYAMDSHMSHEWVLQDERIENHIHIQSFPRYPCGIIGYSAWVRSGSKNQPAQVMVVCFGYDFDFHPICLAFGFRGDHCANPLRDISQETVMLRYHDIIPEMSSTEYAKADDADLYAVKGKQKTSSARYIHELEILVQFFPTGNECHLQMDFGPVKVAQETLPEEMEDSESLESLLRLFAVETSDDVTTPLFEQGTELLDFSSHFRDKLPHRLARR